MWKWITATLHGQPSLAAELRTPRALRSFLARLAQETPEKALRAVAEVFDAAPELGIAPAPCLQALCMLDELAQGLRRALTARLLDPPPRQALCEPAWNALSHSYSAAAQGYTALLEALSHARGNDRLHALGALAACRAMHAMAKHNMLQRVRHREASPELWLRIERLFAGAQAHARAEAALMLYPDEAAETTLVREYLVALLFELAPGSNLLPAQIHAVDLLLRAHASDYRMGGAFDRAAAPFVLDPNRDARPRRWPNGLPPWPGMRFFGLGEAYRRILAERERVSRARGIPAQIAASQITGERYREMLDALCIHWALTPPRRRQLRRPARGEVLVAHDLALIRRLVQSAELARSARAPDHDGYRDHRVDTPVHEQDDARLHAPGAPAPVLAKDVLRNLEKFERKLGREAIDLWRLADTSPDGIGAEAGGTAAWLKVGMLVAYRQPHDPHWAMAVVRRLSRSADETLRVGLRKLHGQVRCARVTLNDPRQRGPESEAAPALSYEAIQLIGDDSFLLLRPGVFDAAWRYTLSVGHRWDFIRMRRCVECGFDFEQVAYAVTRVRQAA